MNTAYEMKKIWRGMVSGVVISNDIEKYERLLDYLKSEQYKKDLDYDAINELDESEIESIINDIKAGKKETKDAYGKRIQVVSKEDLNKENTYLMRKANSLFEIVTGKIEDILKTNSKRYYHTSRMILKDDLWLYVSEGESDYNMTLITNNEIMPQQDVYGTMLFVGRDMENEWDNTCTISAENIINITEKTNFMMGQGVLDITELNFYL